MGPDFVGSYSIRDVGAFPAEAIAWGINIKPGTTDVLLLRQGESAGYPISQITVGRDTSGHFNAFVGAPTTFFGSTGGLDGSLALAPGNVILLTSYNDEFISEIKAGSTTVNKRVNLVDLGFGVGGSLAIVPSGFPGSGRLKVMGVLGWYDGTLSSDGDGTFNVSAAAANVLMTNTLTGAIYVRAGTPRFTNDSVLILEDDSTTVAAYQVNGNGDPILSSKRSFIVGQSATFTGAIYDPVSKDFVLAGFNRHLYIVGSFGVAPLTVSITSPVSGSSYVSNSAVTLTAEAAQANGSISKVVFFQGAAQVGDPVFQAPYSTTAGPLQAGTYSFTAVAYGSGASVTSSVVSITVTNPPSNVPPVISWLNPTTNVSLSACSSIIVKANVTDPDRPLSNLQKVEFFVNGIKLSEAASPPYAFQWSDLGVGTYTLTLRATDIDDGVTTSTPIIATVSEPKPNTLGASYSGTGAARLPVVCLGGLLGRNYVLESSSNLLNWVAVTNVTSTNLVTRYVDTTATNGSARYFRAKFLP